ncbi:hypothetical protein AAFC00_001053 [Neodothiora populina]|uniref:ASST-domain-containing protein n=1 Tax=Neodothiora populina TaxID=2781224 RepID=A0ABR3PMM8_9PEZI
MKRIGCVLLYLLFTLLYVKGDDVGDNFDPDDGRAWEEDYGEYPYRSYRTSDLTSPVVRRIVNTPACYDDHYIFVTLRGEPVSTLGPMILDDKGHLIWALDIGHDQPYNLKVQQYRGQKHLTFWVGDDTVGGHGEGYYSMLNSSYQEVARLEPVNGLHADLHELTITLEGTALFSIYQITAIKAYGKRIWIWDCLFQEVDLETNHLLFEWRASDHHSLDETYSSIGTHGRGSQAAWDWFHLNSIQKDDLGNYFVSARYTNTLSYIDGRTGKIIWILGGKRNMFKDLSNGQALNFASQHYARLRELIDFPELLKDEIRIYQKAVDRQHRSQKLVSLFDNGADDRIRVREVSRGMILQISYPTRENASQSRGSYKARTSEMAGIMSRSPSLPSNVVDGYTVKLVNTYIHPENLSSDSQGNLEIIPSKDLNKDPTIGLGYGQRPVFTEFAANGRVICDTHFAPQVAIEGTYVQSYRVFKDTWKGQPLYPPAVKIDAHHDTIYVSWNGATEVKTWQLQHSSEPKTAYRWDPVLQVPRQGFESKIDFDGDEIERYVRVVALDRDGNTLGISRIIDRADKEYLITIETSSNATAVISTSNPFDHLTTPNSSFRLAMFCLCAISFVLTVYACYRHWHDWRHHNLDAYGLPDDYEALARLTPMIPPGI